MATPSHPIWIVPGAPWLHQVNACRRILIEAAKNDRPLGISELVTILPLNPVDESSIADIVARGMITFANGAAENDGGEVTRASFFDDNIGSLRIVIPKVFRAASVSVNSETLSLVSADPKILLVLADMPETYPFSGNFLLESIALDETSSSYMLRDQIEPFGAFEIKVDLEQSLTSLAAVATLRAMPAYRRRKLSLAMKAMANGNDVCSPDAGKPVWYIVKASFGVCRIQHENEQVLGTIKYGPATQAECQERLRQLENDGTCA